jgi:hypothetical protein
MREERPMIHKTQSRRAFLKGASLAAAPLAAAGAAAAVAKNEHEAKIERLQAEAAIRDLHQDWLRKVNTGDRAEAARLHDTVSRVDADHAGAPDAITVTADGHGASGLYHCVIETETPRPLDCTLAQMAAFQGEGMTRTREARVLKADYVKNDKGWAIASLRFEEA